MARSMNRIHPLNSPIHRMRVPRRIFSRRIIAILASLPGSDERLVTQDELDQLRRTLPNRVTPSS